MRVGVQRRTSGLVVFDQEAALAQRRRDTPTQRLSRLIKCNIRTDLRDAVNADVCNASNVASDETENQTHVELSDPR